MSWHVRAAGNGQGLSMLYYFRYFCKSDRRGRLGNNNLSEPEIMAPKFDMNEAHTADAISWRDPWKRLRADRRA